MPPFGNGCICQRIFCHLRTLYHCKNVIEVQQIYVDEYEMPWIGVMKLFSWCISICRHITLLGTILYTTNMSCCDMKHEFVEADNSSIAIVGLQGPPPSCKMIESVRMVWFVCMINHNSKLVWFENGLNIRIRPDSNQLLTWNQSI